MAAKLAPAAILRAAAWPVQSLGGFGACEADSLPGVHSDDQAPYERSLAHDRILIQQRTVADDAFMKALAVSNPPLARRVLGLATDEPRTKRVRHLEVALFRYLSRAVGRTVPFGGWAGVTVVPWRESGARPRGEARARSELME